VSWETGTNACGEDRPFWGGGEHKERLVDSKDPTFVRRSGVFSVDACWDMTRSFVQEASEPLLR
jgi:hypothetical protein